MSLDAKMSMSDLQENPENLNLSRVFDTNNFSVVTFTEKP